MLDTLRVSIVSPAESSITVEAHSETSRPITPPLVRRFSVVNLLKPGNDIESIWSRSFSQVSIKAMTVGLTFKELRNRSNSSERNLRERILKFSTRHNLFLGVDFYFRFHLRYHCW